MIRRRFALTVIRVFDTILNAASEQSEFTIGNSCEDISYINPTH